MNRSLRFRLGLVNPYLRNWIDPNGEEGNKLNINSFLNRLLNEVQRQHQGWLICDPDPGDVTSGSGCGAR